MRIAWKRHLGLVAAAVVLLLTALLVLWRNPQWWLLAVAHWAEPTLRSSSIQSPNSHTLVLEGLRVGPADNPYFIAESLRVSWNWKALLTEQRLAEVTFDRPRASLDGLEKAYPPAAAAASTDPAPERQKKSWFSPKLDLLRIQRGVVVLDNLGSDQLRIPITLGARKPLEIRNLNLETSVIEAEANDILITSPYDALSPVLAIKSIIATFTWDGLLHQHIEKLTITKPVVYLGPDLFWYTDQIQKTLKPESPAAASVPATPWTLDQFDLKDGRLAVNVSGVPNFTFPFLLQSHSDQPLKLENLTQLALKNTIVIVPGDLNYDDYGVRIKNLNGFLAFNLPPSDGKARNINPTVKLDNIQFKTLLATDGKGWITFDRNGVYGGLDALAYSGHIGAGFSFLFKDNYPWNGWVYADKVSLQPVMKALAPEYCTLTGRLAGKITVKAQSKDIQNASGVFQLLDHGRMEIKSIDQLAEKLPTEWPGLKRDAVKVFLNAFRNYDYTSGKITGTFQAPYTKATLELQGAQGRRFFDLSWKQEPAILKPKTVSDIVTATTP
jgi:hypothetical protein